MNTGLKVYIAHADLLDTAKQIVEVVRNVTKDNETSVAIELDHTLYPMNQSYNQGYTYPMTVSGSHLGSSYTTTPAISSLPNQSNVGTITFGTTTGGTTTSGTSLWTNPPYTTNIGSIPQGQWSIPYVAPAPVTPDQIPPSHYFEQMVVGLVKQLNEAYNLGRMHGYVEGKEAGVTSVHSVIEELTDVDILSHSALELSEKT
jgi:hypothetical protein